MLVVRTKVLSLTAFWVSMALSTTGVPAQEVVELTAPPRRPASEAVFQPVLTIPAVPEATITVESQIHRSSSGIFSVGALVERFTWAEFGPDGRFTGVFGREGQGPGESRRIMRVVAIGDSIRVVFHDQRYSRLTRAGEFIKTGLLPGVPIGAVDFGGEGLIVPFLQTISGSEAITLARFDAFGELLEVRRSAIPPNPRDRGTIAGKVAQDDDDSIFIAHYWEYRISVLDTLGNVQKEIRRNPDWWEDPDSGEKGPWLPRSTMQAAHVEGDQLWLVYSVRKPGAEWGGMGSVEAFEALNHFVLEVVDLSGGRVVLSQRFEGFPFHGSLGDHVYKMCEDPVTGELSYEILDPLLAESG